MRAKSAKSSYVRYLGMPDKDGDDGTVGHGPEGAHRAQVDHHQRGRPRWQRGGHRVVRGGRCRCCCCCCCCCCCHCCYCSRCGHDIAWYVLSAAAHELQWAKRRLTTRKCIGPKGRERNWKGLDAETQREEGGGGDAAQEKGDSGPLAAHPPTNNHNTTPPTITINPPNTI